MLHNYLEEALSYYNLAASNVMLIRHNENLTYRIGSEYLLQIHEHVEGFNTEYIYEDFNRIEIRKTEISFQNHLKNGGMIIRETVENYQGELITKLSNGTFVTVSKWIEGDSLDHFELNDDLCFKIGDLIANLHKNAIGFKESSVVSYDKKHCEYIKKRIKALEKKGLNTLYANIMNEACDLVGRTLQNVQTEFIMLHGDLSLSNILNTPKGLVAIDYSFLGIGHPMLDLAILFGNIGGLLRRKKIVEGYQNAGGIINYIVLDACFILSLLDGIAIHFEKWSRQDWFNLRMKRWYNETLEPFMRGERLFSDDFILLNLPNY